VSAPTSGTHLEAKGITVERDGRLLADSIDVDVPSGTFVGLLGPNGSGGPCATSSRGPLQRWH